MQPHHLIAYIVSDVHMNSHPYGGQYTPGMASAENPRSKQFREFLTEINRVHHRQDLASHQVSSADHVILLVNGDILDITGSWYDEPLPWDKAPDQVSNQLIGVLQDILENNCEVVQELRRFLAHPRSELVYVFGNHDGLLELYPEAQTYLCDYLVPDGPENQSSDQQSADPPPAARIRFVPHYESKTLNLYAEHGHRLDPMNVYDSKQAPPLGDVINVLVVNRFVERTVERLQNLGYSVPFIQSIQPQLHDVEYLRPLSLLPYWIESVAMTFHNHPHSEGKIQSVETILRTSIADTLRDPQVVQFIRERLHIPRTFLRFVISLLVQFTFLLPFLSFAVSRLVRRTHSNTFQYKTAQKLHKEKGYRLITYGHTHIPGVMALSTAGYFINTGSWKPVINLFKFNPNQFFDLIPWERQFKKIERCGILKIVKDLSQPDLPPEFSLETTQSGLS